MIRTKENSRERFPAFQNDVFVRTYEQTGRFHFDTRLILA